MTTIPIVMSKAGRVSTSPADLRSALVALVSATNPDFTANLPGSMVEDIVSTDVATLSLCDQFVTELVNSLNPLGANEQLLLELGSIYGVTVGAATNTSVFLTFSGTPGFVIAKGFVVSDGVHQYVVQDGGVIGASGSSALLFAVSPQAGSWAVPEGSVTTVATSVPSSITVTVSNPQDGIPSADTESTESYRARVLIAGVAASMGMGTYLKTLVGQVAGVQSRLVSVRQQTSGWSVIVGGGDPYAVAYAIYTALFDISTLVPSVIHLTGITNASPGVATSDLNHNLITGQTVVISGAAGGTWATINGSHVVTVITSKTFSFAVNTTSLSTYTANSATISNARNISAQLIDYPDVYTIRYISPPQQAVAISLTWNTTAVLAVPADAVAQLGAPALVAYVNAIAVGLPINLFELEVTFQQAIADLIPPQLLTRMVFSVSINGVGVSPTGGTGIIAGDPESYFLTDASQITITQG